MIKNTLVIVGPGGVGKGPLASLIKPEAVTIDPYRLRSGGPRRDSPDPLYANPKLRPELHAVLTYLGDVACPASCHPEQMEWFPKSQVLFFTVRGEWQCLFFRGLAGDVGKAELYAPILPALLGIAEIKKVVGAVSVMVLNPTPTPLVMMQDWSELERVTRENCQKRGDTPESVQKRVGTLAIEAQAWRTLVASRAASEILGWSFPEYRFKTEENRELLRAARTVILEQHSHLRQFFKSTEEI